MLQVLPLYYLLGSGPFSISHVRVFTGLNGTMWTFNTNTWRSWVQGEEVTPCFVSSYTTSEWPGQGMISRTSSISSTVRLPPLWANLVGKDILSAPSLSWMVPRSTGPQKSCVGSSFSIQNCRSSVPGRTVVTGTAICPPTSFPPAK